MQIVFQSIILHFSGANTTSIDSILKLPNGF